MGSFVHHNKCMRGSHHWVWYPGEVHNSLIIYLNVTSFPMVLGYFPYNFFASVKSVYSANFWGCSSLVFIIYIKKIIYIYNMCINIYKYIYFSFCPILPPPPKALFFICIESLPLQWQEERKRFLFQSRDLHNVGL